MNWKWYKLFNYNDFIASNVVSQNLTVFLDGIGQTDFVINRGLDTVFVYKDVLLLVYGFGRNPYIGLGEKYGVYVSVDADVYLGVSDDA